MSKQYSNIDDFLKAQLIKAGRVLVVGSKVYGSEVDRREKYLNAVGLDMQDGKGVDIVHDLEKPLKKHGKFDHIDLVSVLEHVQRPWLMAENIVNLMTPDATILIQSPFSWRLHNYPGDYWRYTVKAYEILFPSITWEESGYLMDGIFSKLPERLNHEDKNYVQRCEAIAFGRLIS